MKLQSVTLRGYKSIAALESFPLRNLNVLIGANGAGKSNFLGMFKLLAALANGNLQTFVQLQGGPDALLYGGRKRTDRAEFEIIFDRGDHSAMAYIAGLTATADNRLIFDREDVCRLALSARDCHSLGAAHGESRLRGARHDAIALQIRVVMERWRQYHFHDTGDSALVKRHHNSNDTLRLKPTADNLAAYLVFLKGQYPQAYERIVATIQLAAPYFGGFVMRTPLPDKIELEWFEQADPDTPLKAHVLSDGTLRFVCLTTLLMQPVSLLPDLVLIDEPELGLHPYAINLLAEMLKQVAETKQVIVATQSVELLNAFEPQDVVIVDRVNSATTLQRLDDTPLQDWLADYSLGELWKRNVLGGRPSR